MRRYVNRSGQSGVTAFEIGDRMVTVVFNHEWAYVYGYDRPGREAVEEMKRLARDGRGLSTFISRNVRENYQRRYRIRAE